MCKTRMKGLTLYIILLVTTVILISQTLITPYGKTLSSMLSSFNVLMIGEVSMLDQHDILQTTVVSDHSDSLSAVNNTFVGSTGNVAKLGFGEPNTSILVDRTAMSKVHDDDSELHDAGNFRNKIMANVGAGATAEKHGGEEVKGPTSPSTENDGFAFSLDKSPSHEPHLDSENSQNNNSGFLSLQPLPATVNTHNYITPTNQQNVLLSNSSGMEAHMTDYIFLHNSSTKDVSNNLTKPPVQDSQVAIVKLSPEEIENILKWKRKAPSISILEINHKLLNHIAFPNPMRPRWTSQVDRQIMEAVARIKSAPVPIQQELYAPAFRNISAFARSYDLMDHMLKVYIYREGEKPIFHQPRLKGIYASEGWFMKQIEESKHFRVKDPRKAHLFYLPFSSSKLRSIGSPGPGKKKLVKFLEAYVDLIAAKHPFWNRTNGADHFLAACHDWAPYMTRRYFVHSIRALCNADALGDFQLGKDVSLPTTNMILTVNPLRDIGGRHAKKRPALAFFAGRPHGYLRNILFELWENKDPDLKIYGGSFQGPIGAKAYAEHMQTSKYCLCPRGYEVHTPRVIESILYSCVPVIISDNYVPPFFEVLNWEEFAVFIPEKEIVRLKEILLSIPPRKYLAMRTVVNKVRQHFVWHASPVKYDIFHMILHSVWNSRLNRVQTW